MDLTYQILVFIKMPIISRIKIIRIQAYKLSNPRMESSDLQVNKSDKQLNSPLLF
jgi:hypothetical protein